MKKHQPIIDGDISSEQTILILGGYGNAGFLIAKMLLQVTTNVKVILSGRNLIRAQEGASKLNTLFGTDRCSAIEMDASKQPFHFPSETTIDLVVVASPSLGSTVTNVVEAAITAKVDYMDIQFSTTKLDILRSMEDKINMSGQCFITEGGFHPGLPAALVRYAAGRLDRIREANVGCLMFHDWGQYEVGSDAKEEFASEMMNFDSQAYTLGKWNPVSWTKPKLMNFDGFGDRQCMAMNLEEMHHLPIAYPDLQELGYYMAGLNTFVDWFLFPFVAIVLLLCPCRPARRAMGHLLYWGLKVTSRPPYGNFVKAEVKGTNGGRDVSVNVTLFHKDGYWLTAAPTVACILQYLSGSIRKPGLWFQGNCVEPARFMRDIQSLGVECKTEILGPFVSK